MSKVKLVCITILFVALVVFITYNMHITNFYIPFIKPVQIRVIFLLLIGFLLGSATVLGMVMYNGHKKKVIEKFNRNNKS